MDNQITKIIKWFIFNRVVRPKLEGTDLSQAPVPDSNDAQGKVLFCLF